MFFDMCMRILDVPADLLASSRRQTDTQRERERITASIEHRPTHTHTNDMQQHPDVVGCGTWRCFSFCLFRCYSFECLFSLAYRCTRFMADMSTHVKFILLRTQYRQHNAIQLTFDSQSLNDRRISNRTCTQRSCNRWFTNTLLLPNSSLMMIHFRARAATKTHSTIKDTHAQRRPKQLATPPWNEPRSTHICVVSHILSVHK